MLNSKAAMIFKTKQKILGKMDTEGSVRKTYVTVTFTKFK